MQSTVLNYFKPIARTLHKRQKSDVIFNNFLSRLSKTEFEHIIQSANSWYEACNRCGFASFKSGNSLRIHHYNVNQVSQRCTDLNIDFTHLLGTSKSKYLPAHNEVRTNTEQVKRLHTKRLTKILQTENRHYSCEMCYMQNPGFTWDNDTKSWLWYGAKIILQIDHINGNAGDNVPSNLRYLCPNCHAVHTEKQNETKRVLAKEQANKTLETLKLNHIEFITKFKQVVTPTYDDNIVSILEIYDGLVKAGLGRLKAKEITLYMEQIYNVYYQRYTTSNTSYKGYKGFQTNTVFSWDNKK